MDSLPTEHYFEEMKKATLILVLFCFGIALNAQTESNASPLSKPNQAFDVGEWFQFRIHYGIFNASYASLEILSDTLDQTPVFHAKGYGTTTGLARWFFKVEDHYDSYFTKDTGLPLFFKRDINEGGYTKDVEIHFDHQEGTALVNNLKKKRKERFDIKEKTQDLISVFYYLRNFYAAENLKQGESIGINLFFDQENYLFKLKFIGRENLETKFGKVPCLKFRPYVQSGRVFKEEESVTIWVSDDPNKIPIKLRADLRVGAIDCDLENFKNLKHPFNLIID